MKPPQLVRLVALTALAALSGCQSMQQLEEVKKPTVEQTAEVRKGPEDRPQRSITGFSDSLRCMDTLMLDYGVHDVSMLTEDLTDETKKMNAGTRDMLISSVSDMSRRSRAVHLVAFGKDTMNVIGFMASAQSSSAYHAIPLYDIKGSVSQFDENLIKNQKDMGAGVSPFLNLGIARDAASSMLSLDMSVLTTSDMALMNGVTSRNSIIILKQGSGLDGDAAIKKFGVNYSMNFARAEGQSQALRTLVELGTVELVGKLTKTPYWSCLGVSDPMANDETRLEMFDWYHSMAATRVELIAYFQNQLRRRAFYDGPIDGEFNPALDEAISNYRSALGLTHEALINEQFFYAFLSADHTKIKRPDQPAHYVAPATVAAAAPAPAPAPSPSPSPSPSPAPAPTPAPAAPLQLSLSTPRHQTRFARGEPINLALAPSQDANVYCYLQDEDARITRFFPNRFTKDSRIAAAQPLALPGESRFEITMNPKGVSETIACFATPKDVLATLPQTLVGTDFEPLPGATLDTIRAAFVQASGGTFAQENFRVQAQ